MDRIIKKKKWGRKKLISISVSAIIVLLILSSFYFSAGRSKLNVEAARLTISEVKKSTFQEFIPVNGVVLPITTIYLDALEGGRVEEKYAEDGAIMKKGQAILKLSNTDLELSLVNQETSVFNLLTQMQISRNAARQNTISKLNQMAEVENALKEAQRVYELNRKLVEQGVIGSQEFKQSELAYEHQLKRKKFTEQILKQDSISTSEEFDQASQSYERMKNALTLMRRKVDDLIVKSPIDGQLTSLDAEIGQSKNKGERLGQIDALGGYKVRVDVDEHYISRVFTGLQGECLMGDKIYRLTIKKVYTQVSNGRFQVDMQYNDSVPNTIRRGQSLQIRLALSDESQAVLVNKGGFYQQTGGNWIFKLGEDGKTAHRAEIQLGRQNPDYFEVMQGLKPGDKVITSGYENFGDMHELILK